MITWIKPSGTEIVTNETDASIEKALELGWKNKDEKKPARRGRKPKEE